MPAKLVLAALAVAVCAWPVASLSVSAEKTLATMPDINTLKRQCLKQTGSKKTYDLLTFSYYYAPMCWTGHLSLVEFANDLQVLTKTTRFELFDKYCPKVNASLKCANPMVKQVRKCWDAEELVFLDIVINQVPDALKLICNDHGEIFFDVDGPGFEECLFELNDITLECAGKLSNVTEAIYLSKYGVKQCAELRDFHGCLSDKLDACNAQGLKNLMDLFYRPLVEASPCQKVGIDINREQNISSKIISPKDVSLKDVSPKDVSPKDVSPKDISPKVHLDGNAYRLILSFVKWLISPDVVLLLSLLLD